MIAATVMWAWPMIFIRYIKNRTGGEFTPDSLNVYRYSSGALFALGAVALTRPGDFLPVLRRWPVPLALAALLAGFQIVWVRGVYMIGATYGTLLSRSTVVFTLLLGFLLFADERRTIRSGRFLLSAAVAVAAVAGVALLDPGLGLSGAAGSDWRVGTALMLASSVLWALYAVAIRKLAARLPPMATFAVTVTVCSLLLLPLGLLDGHMAAMWTSPWDVPVAAVFSGVLCVGATQVLWYVSFRRIGLARTSVVSLASPFLTGVFAFLVLDEKLTPLQWLCGALLVAGLALMIRTSAPPAGGAGVELE